MSNWSDSGGDAPCPWCDAYLSEVVSTCRRRALENAGPDSAVRCYCPLPPRHRCMHGISTGAMRRRTRNSTNGSKA